MPDITMCLNKLCPKAEQCYRITATPSDNQSQSFFNYTVGVNGVECSHYYQDTRVRLYGSHNTLPVEPKEE